ncbi:DoxX family protein [Pseudactinotalea sp.]|uniref:DoxX family protein n=1 Tax=Pseudactinotalea sp. TaxID=1926260 RepID=UPI003B3B0DC2
MTVGTIMALMLAVVLAAIGVTKLLALPPARREADHLGFAVRHYRLIGGAELAAAIGLSAAPLWTPAAIAACIGLVVLLIGALVTLRRAGDPATRALPAIGLGLMTTATAVLLTLGV